MKIAFVGKGGSGKTTISALTSRYLASENFPVLTIDADINQHLGDSLNISEKPTQLGLEINQIKEYLRGSNSLIPDNKSMVKTTPPGPGSNFIKVVDDNPIYDQLSSLENGIRFMAVGEFSEDDLGIRCYHSKTGAVELLLNHMLDGQGEYIVVDMTAGADSFASGLFARFDVTFIVVEPTLKSVSVYKQYEQYAKDYGVVIKVVGNKITSQDDIDFIKEHVGDALVTTLNDSSFVKKADRGEVLYFSGLEPENIEGLKKIISITDSQKKDWKKFYEQAVHFHVKNAESWANVATGKDLTKQIDPSFSLERMVESM